MSLKNLDIYKVIILLSIVLAPAACLFAYYVDEEIVSAEDAIAKATRSGGELEKIGQTLKQLQTIRQNTEHVGVGDSHRLYFERRILAAAKSGLKAADFQISNQQRVAAGRSAQDQEVVITFQRDGKDAAWPREFISAALFNCESGSKSWRLRYLKIRNDEMRDLRGAKAPPKTVEDMWRIEKLVFARREPEVTRKPR